MRGSIANRERKREIERERERERGREREREKEEEREEKQKESKCVGNVGKPSHCQIKIAPDGFSRVDLEIGSSDLGIQLSRL